MGIVWRAFTANEGDSGSEGDSVVGGLAFVVGRWFHVSRRHVLQ